MAFSGYSKLAVLVVDDFDSFRMTVLKILQEMGVRTIDTAVNGAEAVRRCREARYDVILCDHNLGYGKNGHQVLEQLRHDSIISTMTLFVMVSAETSKSIILATYDYEPDAYLGKPITAKTLSQRLDRLLMQRKVMAPIHQALHEGEDKTVMQLCRDHIDANGRYATQCQKILGKLYLQHKKIKNAEQLYKEVLEVRPLDWAKVGMARCKKLQGDLDLAEKWLKDIVGTNPMCMEAYDVLADTYKEKGDIEEQMAVLSQAARISPMALLRQKELADTALHNNDPSVAANAFKKAVRLSENSSYDSLDTYLNYSRSVAQLSEEDKAEAHDLAKDALKAMDSVSKRFARDDVTDVKRHLLTAQLYSCQGEAKKSEELLTETEEMITNRHIDLDVESKLDMACAFSIQGKKDRSKEILNELIDEHKNDEEKLQKIDRLLDEPVSAMNRQLVAEINHEGIHYYEKKQYKKAIKSFKQSQRLFPNHVGVQLNLCQALIGDMDEYGCNEDSLDLCLKVLSKVEAKMQGGHEQLNRFRQLQDKLRVISRAFNAS